jgi:hypothetical protein
MYEDRPQAADAEMSEELSDERLDLNDFINKNSQPDPPA